MKRVVRPLLIAAVGLALFSACGASAASQRTLSAHQVVTALRQHGIPARITWQASEIRGAAAMNDFLGLSGARLRDHWGVIAFVQASFRPLSAPASAVGPPYVDVLVTDTVQHAQSLARRAPTGSNGRTFNVSNVVLQSSLSAVPRIAPAVLHLLIEAAHPGARGWLILRAT